MPCNSDYMSPTEREQELKLTAELFCWLMSIQRKRAPAWAHKAAGDTYGKGADKLVSKLCAEMSRLNGIIPPHDGSLGNQVREGQLIAWWAKHEAADAARRRHERHEHEVAARRDEALKKLTPEDLEILGLS